MFQCSGWVSCSEWQVLLLLLVHLLLERWGWLGEAAGSELHDVASLVILDSQLGGVPGVSVSSGLTSDTDNTSVDGA